MAKRGSWYFEGYQSEEVLDRSGRTRQRLVYRGEWYGLGLEPAALRRCKLLCLALAAVCTVVYFLINLFPAQGGMTPWVGGPCLLALVPLIFLWIGLVNFLPARTEWELRVLYAGYRRLKRWNIVFLALMAVTLAAEAAYMIRFPAGAVAELPYALGAAVCVGLSAGLLLLQRRHPALVVRGPDVR